MEAVSRRAADLYGDVFLKEGWASGPSAAALPDET